MANARKSIWRIVGEAIFGAPRALLPRDQVINALNETIKRSWNGQFTASVMLFEIDRFRHLEQTRDTKEIAHVIRVLQERLTGGPCARDMLRQMGGGRFAVVPSPLRKYAPDMLEKLALEIQTVAENPIQHPSQDSQVSVSIGFAIQSELEGADGDTLFDAANAALISAGNQGPAATCGFSPAMREKLLARRELATAAKTAIASGGIHAHFQPQVDTLTHKIIGVEALARWKHDERGMLPPSEFLPILEEVGMMQDLGFAMLRNALSALHDWDRAGILVPTVSVNMSTEELLNPHLVDAVAMELDAFSLHPGRLVIEILETVIAGAKEDIVMRNISALHALGCAIDLDDFGTGHASITTIRRFGVDRIKIDRSFITNIGTDVEQQQMVLAILTMSEQLKIATLAEGVETQSELAFLTQHGCSIIQGYAISKPMAQSEIQDWVLAHNFAASTLQPRQMMH